MSVDERHRSCALRGRFRRLSKGLLDALVPREGLSLTREGFFYVVVSIVHRRPRQQVNLILLVFTLTAVCSWPRFSVVARCSDDCGSSGAPAYTFAGDPLLIDYSLENGRRWHAALAIFLGDSCFRSIALSRGPPR